MPRRVERVAVVGRDAAAWLSALAIHWSLSAAGVRVQVLELSSRLSDVDVYPAIPSIAAMHRLLGLEEDVVLRLTGGVPMVAQRFANWAGSAAPFLIAYDDEPPPGGDLNFLQYWLKARGEGLRVGFEDFSLGAMAARDDRVPVPGGSEEGPPLSASYGYHLDAPAYCALLKQLAIHRGIEVVCAGIGSIDVEGERIAGIELADGTKVEADLYVDASGAERALIGRMPGAEFVSWQQWLPCDRMIAASAPRLANLPSFSQVAAFRGGWIGLFPLQHRTAVIAVYSSRAVGDEELAQQIPLLARMPLTGDAVVSELNPGAVDRPWIGNCVAVGEAAIAVEPLSAVQLHVVHGCVSHLMTLFPASADEFPEAMAFNRIACEFAANIRDFQAAHYLLNRRYDEPLWDHARDAAPPETLARKLDVFAARGEMPLYDEESFQESGWAASFLGHGLMPETYDPRVDLLPAEAHIALVRERLKTVAERVRSMPRIDDFVARLREPEAAVL